MIKITGQPIGEIEVKRFYLDGLEMEYVCPECGTEHRWNDYLSYPDINKPVYLSFHCEGCDHEWKEPIILKVSVESFVMIDLD
jgi:hypothetical protein